MKYKTKKIMVVGSGISGITTAISLLEKNYVVHVISNETLLSSTSAIAAAIWHPFYQVPNEQFHQWAQVSYKKFLDFSYFKSSGVFLRPLKEFFCNNICAPWWSSITNDCIAIKKYDLPKEYLSGYQCTIPIIDTSFYLNFLEKLFFLKGGTISQDFITSLYDFKDYDLVINCSGLGARSLSDDPTLCPIRGHILVVKKDDTMNQCIIDDNNPLFPTYIIPRTNDCILGGTAQPDQLSTIFTKAIEDDIISRCKKFLPQIEKSHIISRKIGFRPSREHPRVEFDSEYPFIIHNYGHGGSGYTISWGCAKTVADMADRYFHLLQENNYAN